MHKLDILQTTKPSELSKENCAKIPDILRSLENTEKEK